MNLQARVRAIVSAQGSTKWVVPPTRRGARQARPRWEPTP